MQHTSANSLRTIILFYEPQLGDTSRAKVLKKRCFNPNKHRAKKIVCFANKNEGFKPRLPGPRGGGEHTNSGTETSLVSGAKNKGLKL